MRPTPRARRLVVAVGALSCVGAVAAGGELSLAAHLAIGVVGSTVVVAGLVRRSGETSPPVGRRGLPWLALAAVVGAWELVTLADEDLPTASDLADPLLAEPLLRGAGTVGWLIVGAWLLSRPHGERRT